MFGNEGKALIVGDLDFEPVFSNFLCRFKNVSIKDDQVFSIDFILKQFNGIVCQIQVLMLNSNQSICILLVVDILEIVLERLTLLRLEIERIFFERLLLMISSFDGFLNRLSLQWLHDGIQFGLAE